MSALLTRTLQQIVEQEEAYEAARRAMMRDLRKGFPLGTNGKVDWNQTRYMSDSPFKKN